MTQRGIYVLQPGGRAPGRMEVCVGRGGGSRRTLLLTRGGGVCLGGRRERDGVSRAELSAIRGLGLGEPGRHASGPWHRERLLRLEQREQVVLEGVAEGVEGQVAEVLRGEW